MHWSEELAERIIQKNPDKEEYVCAAGVSPSGSVHIGNFRDIATSLFVVKALEKKGKKARLLISWDEFDRCRKIPANVQSVVGDAYDKYIGCSYVDIPDPWGCHENYAKHFEDEFLRGIAPFGIKLDCRYQAEMYRSGKYRDHLIEALRKRGELDGLCDLVKFADDLEASCIETLDQGIMTKDLVGLVVDGTKTTAVNSRDFIQAIRSNLEKKMA